MMSLSGSLGGTSMSTEEDKAKMRNQSVYFNCQEVVAYLKSHFECIPELDWIDINYFTDTSKITGGAIGWCGNSGSTHSDPIIPPQKGMMLKVKFVLKKDCLDTVEFTKKFNITPPRDPFPKDNGYKIFESTPLRDYKTVMKAHYRLGGSHEPKWDDDKGGFYIFVDSELRNYEGENKDDNKLGKIFKVEEYFDKVSAGHAGSNMTINLLKEDLYQHEENIQVLYSFMAEYAKSKMESSSSSSPAGISFDNYPF